MGLAFSRLWERMFGKKEMRILMVSKTRSLVHETMSVHYVLFMHHP